MEVDKAAIEGNIGQLCSISKKVSGECSKPDLVHDNTCGDDRMYLDAKIKNLLVESENHTVNVENRGTYR